MKILLYLMCLIALASCNSSKHSTTASSSTAAQVAATTSRTDSGTTAQVRKSESETTDQNTYWGAELEGPTLSLEGDDRNLLGSALSSLQAAPYMAGLSLEKADSLMALLLKLQQAAPAAGRIKLYGGTANSSAKTSTYDSATAARLARIEQAIAASQTTTVQTKEVVKQVKVLDWKYLIAAAIAAFVLGLVFKGPLAKIVQRIKAPLGV